MHLCDVLQALLDAWFPLWQWVFQPAIGVLMLGAVSCLNALSANDEYPGVTSCMSL